MQFTVEQLNTILNGPRPLKLQNADLSHANLSNADLRSTRLNKANLHKAQLGSANLSSAHLKDANLSDANLCNADLVYADLSRANLSRADLSRANLEIAKLENADLSWANLSRAHLNDANLSHANLSDADLVYADLSWADLSMARSSGANLSGANLSWASLCEANLSGANLEIANMDNADLSRANLSNADLRSANLYKANLERADLNDAKYSTYTKWPDGFDPKAAGAIEVMQEFFQLPTKKPDTSQSPSPLKDTKSKRRSRTVKTKIISAIPGDGTPTAATDHDHANGDIKLGEIITQEMKTTFETSLLKAAETSVVNYPDSIPIPEPKNKTIDGWFAYYDDCIKCGKPKTHEVLWSRYNEQCDPLMAIPTAEAWRKRYSRWKRKINRE